MWPLLLPLAIVAVVIFLLKKNGIDKINNTRNNTAGNDPMTRGTTPSSSKPVNPRQEQIDRDQAIAKKIFKYGGGACLVLLVAGIIFALNPNMGTFEKTEKLMSIGVPVVIILALIGIGSILPNNNKKASGGTKSGASTEKTDDFYKPYFCDEFGHPHYPTDHNFMQELRRYSDHNARYYNVTFKDYEEDWYIVDGFGNTVNIRNQRVITMRDSKNNYCKIVFK